MRLLVFVPYLDVIDPATVDVVTREAQSEGADLVFQNHNPIKGYHPKNIQHQYEEMRFLASMRSYDKVWVVESDIVPPAGALQNMLAEDAPIVAGLYVFRDHARKPNIMRPDGAGSMAWKELQGYRMECGGGAMGCLLFSTKVMEGFSFMAPVDRAPDGFFAHHCRRKGYRQVARLDVQCDHVLADGTVLRPIDYLTA